MGVIETLGLAGLAGLGAAVVCRWLPARWGMAVGLALAGLIGLETLSIPTHMTLVETPSQVPAIYGWLASRPDDAPALELPTIEARWLDRAAELERQGHEQYLSIFHWHPTPSGYSGFEPPLFWSVIREAKDLPTDESVNFFQCLGVKYVIFHQDQYAPDRWQQIQARIASPGSGLTRLAAFGTDSAYELASPGQIDRASAPWLSLPSSVAAGADYRGFFVWPNPGQAARLAQRSSIGVHVDWQGDSPLESDGSAATPACFARGDTAAPFDAAAPIHAGRYTVSATFNGVTASTSVDVVMPSTGPIPDNPSPAMQLVGGSIPKRDLKPGDVVFTQIMWRLRHRTLDNYLLRLEVVDGLGQVAASSTIDPFDGALETSRWLTGEIVTIGQSAILPSSLAPGTYTVRVLVRYADGATWKMAGPDNNDHDSVDLGKITVI
jgi:hypothetical protein